MKVSNPIETLHAAMAHAAYVAFRDYEYKDRDWEKYTAWRTSVFDRLTKEEKLKMYEQERATGVPMGPEDCLISKTRKHTDYDMAVTAMFPQTWGSTALGFGGIGGQAITSAYVTVIESDLTGQRAVYFGGRLAYIIEQPNEQFYTDISRQSMVDSRLGTQTYERTVQSTQ